MGYESDGVRSSNRPKKTWSKVEKNCNIRQQCKKDVRNGEN